ncbi:DUF4303 domain-containing protein [Streptomyces sp. 3MP-14]|uniref:DUF4303 domain-containing protein n=1 Tax=Streptomyces mimosae TaxID=2586635 RepID=A0A5N5ZZU7_9ACTN|nr:MULTISPECIES: DUF4303 domain-containing protein [Streptomyces]KAB8162017.1 DUF4303 domain-containing protein [Streptomyces mimosae]KAB8173715.1 DUF4303 domain-containing protein [Streptomyces sp. 3MP-14]
MPDRRDEPADHRPDHTVRALVVAGEPLPARVLMALHRLLGLGVAEVRRRVEAGQPLVDVELFGNDRYEVADRLRALLDLLAPHRVAVHECLGGDGPSEENRIEPAALLRLVAAPPEPAPEPVRPLPDPALSALIAEATGAAYRELRHRHPERLYLFALLTSGEANAPYAAACSVEGDARGGERWSLPDSPYAVWGYEEHFADVTRAFLARGDLFDPGRGGEAAVEAEYRLRLASMEEALRRLDAEGLFGTGRERGRLLLAAGTMPPDEEDAGAVRRLNPPGALREEWLRDAAEQPPLPADPVAAAERAAHTGPLAPPPNPTVAELWRLTPGWYLPDGTALYGPHSLAERNATYEVARYAPGWALVGDDGGGDGLLMRAPGPAFAPATGRASAEVFRLGLGALAPDVADEGTFVTDDLIGWATGRRSE